MDTTLPTSYRLVTGFNATQARAAAKRERARAEMMAANAAAALRFAEDNKALGITDSAWSGAARIYDEAAMRAELDAQALDRWAAAQGEADEADEHPTDEFPHSTSDCAICEAEAERREQSAELN